MADTKITVDFNAKIKQLEDYSKKVSLNPAAKKSYDTKIQAASLAFDSKNFKAASDNFVKAANYLQNAVAANKAALGGIDALTKQKAGKETDLAELQEKKAKLTSIVNADYFKDFFSTRNKIKTTKGGTIKVHDSVAKGYDELLKQGFGSSLSWNKLNNQASIDAGFADRDSARLAKSYMEGYNILVDQNKNEAAAVDSEIITTKSEIVDLETQIKEISEVAGPASENLRNLYQSISDLASETHNQLSQANTEQISEEAAQSNNKDAQIAVAENTKQLDKQTSSLGRAFKAFSIYNIAIRSLRTAVKSATNTIKELDKSLTEQAMVTGKTRKETYKLLGSYQELAAQLGATTKEVASVTTEYMRQGKTTEEALTLTAAAISAAKVAAISASESINYLTTALNGFRLSAQDAMIVSDKFAAVAANSATSYDELATALSKVASQANLADMSIDYTTALLAKGIETTREAPETIGTALKTVIARMRELSDYGETLTDGTDINNVETQLAYVGIALRNDIGELRSTEDVLNDLGSKWDTLNKNQQAAVAKALAGTRQQSRLIAMMSDYERVTELQQISERSAGATSAQMAVYMEGIEASLNKVSIAWENIVSNLTNSEVIVVMIDAFASLMSDFGDFLGTLPGVIAALTVISLISTNIIGKKLIENKLGREQQKIAIKQQKLELAKNKQLAEENIKERAILITNKKQLITDLQQLSTKRTLTAKEQTQLKTLQNEVLELELAQRADQSIVESYDSQVFLLNESESILSSISSSFSGIIIMAGSLFAMLTKIVTLGGIINKQKKIEGAQTEVNTGLTMKQTIAEKIKAAWAMASSAAATPVVGWGIALAILAAIGIGVAVAVSKANKQEEKASEKMKELSAEIYNLNQAINTIESAESAFQSWDSKIIKTKEDLEALNETLDSTADKLSSDKKDNILTSYNGASLTGSEQDYYNSLSTVYEKQAFLNEIKKAYKDAEGKKRQEQYNQYKTMLNVGWRTEQKDFMSNADNIQMMKNNARATLYNLVDEIEDEDFANAIEELGNNYASLFDIHQAASWFNEENNWKSFIDTIKSAGSDLKGNSMVEILTSDDYNIYEKIQAYDALATVLGKDHKLLTTFYSDVQKFSQWNKQNPEVLNFIAKKGYTTSQLNQFSSAGSDLEKYNMGINQESWTANYFAMLETLSRSNGDITAVIDQFYGENLSKFEKGSEAYEEAYNALVNTFTNITSIGILNMGQNLEALNNAINNFYEQASKWKDLSESEKTEFLTDNSDLFSGTDGEKLLKAFESGNYNEIKQALESNSTLQSKVQTRLAELEQELINEQARIGSDRNEAYIAYLQEWISQLQNTTELFSASLELLISQENEQLDLYKTYLEEQQNALVEALEERKDAYSKYFEEINQMKEDEDYEEEAQQILTNLNRLGAGTDATTAAKRRDLETKLQDLEKERLQTLRERAQESITQDIDDQINDINDKFDELLESDAKIAQLLSAQISDPQSFLSNLYNSKALSGYTELQLQEYAQSLQDTYGSILTGVNWDNFAKEINSSSNTNNYSLNLSQNLTETQLQTLGSLLSLAMKNSGVR